MAGEQTHCVCEKVRIGCLFRYFCESIFVIVVRMTRALGLCIKFLPSKGNKIHIGVEVSNYVYLIK